MCDIPDTMDWVYYAADKSEEYSVEEFDDGNACYSQYANVWYKCGEWRGKVSLVNKFDESIKIGSISLWKVIRLEK